MPAEAALPTTPEPPWQRADAALAALETALKAAAVETASGDGFVVAISHLRKITDMRARFAHRHTADERFGIAGKREALPAARRVLFEDQASTYTGLSARTLQRLRAEGGGPTFVRLSGRVGYTVEDLDQWINDQRAKKEG